MEDGDVGCGRFGHDVFDKAVQQFCSVLDRELRVCSKLIVGLSGFSLVSGNAFDPTLHKASKT